MNKKRRQIISFTATVVSVTVFTSCASAISQLPSSPKSASSSPYAQSRETIEDGQQGKLDRYTDGDTIRIAFGDDKESTRLIGIDTPETVDPRKEVQCYGPESSAFVKDYVPKGTKVKVELDEDTRDRYGRLLAYVYVEKDGEWKFLNAELAKRGFAKVLTIPPNVEHAAEFKKLVVAAKENNLGRWSACAGTEIGTDIGR